MNRIKNKEVIIRQIRSSSGKTKKQKSNLNGLGLKRIGDKSSLLCSESNLGMIKKISHLIEISIN